jgi:hypothetical protein
MLFSLASFYNSEDRTHEERNSKETKKRRELFFVSPSNNYSILIYTHIHIGSKVVRKKERERERKRERKR